MPERTCDKRMTAVHFFVSIRNTLEWYGDLTLLLIQSTTGTSLLWPSVLTGVLYSKKLSLPNFHTIAGLHNEV
jgi:hypothetical protein